MKKEKKILVWLLISQIYCLILGWFNGQEKLNYLLPYFFHFFTWFCTWNCLLTIFFVIWKLKNPHLDTYFTQLFSLIIMISNLITVTIYTIGLLIWLITYLTTVWGITDKPNKIVPIPSHKITGENGLDKNQLFKVIHWWLYSPIWHLVAPAYFIYWFFRHTSKNLLKKNIKFTILSSLVEPTFYFTYCYLHSKLGNREYANKFNARWPYFFFSSKKMAKIFGFDRWVWKLILIVFWLSLFALLVYYSLQIKDYEKLKKEKNITQIRKKAINS